MPNGSTFTTHVFLEEVAADDPEKLIPISNYAGSFTLPGDESSVEENRGTVRLGITAALRKAEQAKPNFHITFLSTGDPSSTGSSILEYESIHILHRVPEHTDLDLSANVTCGLAVEHKDPR